jgi:AcrR family transcriptional regulator
MAPTSNTSSTRRSACETRAAILDSAVSEFTRVGYEATTLEGIAENLNLTRPAVLYHFKSKELLLQAVIDPAFNNVEAVVDTLPIVDSPTRKQQKTAVRTILDVLIENRGGTAVVARTPTTSLTCGIGERTQRLNVLMGFTLVGKSFDTDPALQVRAMACLAALSGLMAARVPVDITDEAQRETITNGLVALLRS